MMNIKKNLKNGVAVVTTLSMPALAADNSTSALMPNLAKGWAGLPDNVRTWIVWILGTAFAIFVAIAILYTFGGTIKAILSGKRGDVHGQSSGISDAFLGVGIIIVAVIAIMLIIFIASSV